MALIWCLLFPLVSFTKASLVDKPDICRYEVNRATCRPVHQWQYYYHPQQVRLILINDTSQLYLIDSTLFQDKCLPFMYGGCQSNGNKFNSLSDCYAVCSDKRITKFGNSVKSCQGLALPTAKYCDQVTTGLFWDPSLGQCRWRKGCQKDLNSEGINFYSTFDNCVTTCAVDKGTWIDLKRAKEEQIGHDYGHYSVYSAKDLKKICTRKLADDNSCQNKRLRWIFDTNAEKCVQALLGDCIQQSKRVFDFEIDCIEMCILQANNAEKDVIKAY